MPPRQDSLGERISGLEARFDGLEKYQHEWRHSLNNTLQPLVNLPTQIARDIAKIQGTFDGRIATITKEIERSITAAVEKAIEPVNADIAALKADVEELKAARNQDEGAKSFIAAVFKSPLLAWVVALAGMLYAYVSGRNP